MYHPTPPPPQFQVSSSRSRGTGGQCFYFSKWNNPEWAFKASRNFRNLIPDLINFSMIFKIFYNPLFTFLRSPKRERKKKKTFLKKSPGEKSNTPPFFTILGPDFVERKSTPFPGDFRNSHAVPPTPEWGGGGVDEDWSSRPGVFKTYSGRLSLQLFQGKPVHIFIIFIFEKGFGWGIKEFIRFN